MNKNDKVKSMDAYKGLPQDLWPRKVWIGEGEGGGLPVGYDRAAPPPYLYSGIYLSRSFRGRVVQVLTTPTLIVSVSRSWPYLLLNPARSVGLTTSGLVSAGTVIASGNTQATPIGVANYLQMHFYLIITAIAGTYDFYLQVRDPQTNQWIDAQTIYAAMAATGNFYALVGGFGVPVDIAVRWDMVAAGAMTFSLAYTLKEGTAGSGSGLAQTVYIGPDRDVNVTCGFPIMEGAQQTFIVGDNTDVWGIAEVETPIRVFQL